MSRPLDGLLVVAVEQAVAAPFATRQLADLGARVIKIERPDGGDFARGYDTTVNGLSSYFVWLNRGKESLTLDLKRPEAAQVLVRLLARADVFVENLGPGAADRLDLSPASLTARYGRLIACRVTGYGSSGPYATKKAYDLLVQSEVGLVDLTGTPEDPARVGISVADIAAGMYAYSGILTALLARARHGRGTTLEVSLFDALSEWMSAPEAFTFYGGRAPARTGAHHASIAPYGPYPTGDGQTVYFGIQNAREWTRFCADVLGQPALGLDERFRTNSDRVANRPALDAIIAGVFDRLAAADVLARLDEAGIATARQNPIGAFRDHPQRTARARWRDVDSPAGPIRALVPPVDLAGVEPAMGAIPTLGQHTGAILDELGYDAATVDAWRREGII
ncbi:MAG TPA: CaiB/BaiF CoA-transferase family protein [Vicinamibacterales bacterium]|nr:CaiB/BaiF CoA-transferase family protein [Vicinamibacterales bacterium]